MGDEYGGQWQQSVISEWQISNEGALFISPSPTPPPLCSGSVEKEVGKCDVQRGRSDPGKVGLLWREMAIYVAENGVGLSDISIALQARVTFSGKQND